MWSELLEWSKTESSKCSIHSDTTGIYTPPPPSEWGGGIGAQFALLYVAFYQLDIISRLFSAERGIAISNYCLVCFRDREYGTILEYAKGTWNKIDNTFFYERYHNAGQSYCKNLQWSHGMGWTKWRNQASIISRNRHWQTIHGTKCSQIAC